MPSPLEAALEYARLGYAVFPLQPGEKRPHGRLVPHGLKEASQDPATLQRWWRAAPEAGVGLLPPPEVLVLDLDRPALWEELRAAYPVLEEAPRQRTPTKGGLHVFLRLPPALVGALSATARRLEGLDLRGMGKAYVVAAPTRLEAGPYRWEVPLRRPEELPLAPEGLLLELLPPPPKPPEPLRLEGQSASPKRLRALLESYARAVATAPEGTRHNTLIAYARAAGGLLPHGLDRQEAEEALVAAGMAAGLPEREAREATRWGLEVGERAPLELEDRPRPMGRLRVRVGGEASQEEEPLHPLDGLAGGGEVLTGAPRYLVKGGAIYAARVEGKREARVVTYWPLANFAAVITREVRATDGVETETLFEIEGYLANGRPLPLARVRGAEFSGLAWVTREWGSEAVITPGQGAKDHLRAAIQYLSLGRTRRATIYRHLGWTRIGGAWVYLHARGGIGPEGAVEGVEVEPGRALEGFVLPAPPEGAEEARAIEELWALLRVAPARVTAPLLLYALTAPLGHTPFTLYLAGPTGARKTSLALVLQSLWGPHASPPLGWEATPNALEAAAFAAKDSLLLVDDYAPQSSEGKQKELQAKAARILRSQGNATGRLRMRADGSLTGDKPPRGAILATGEDLPPGHSVRARTLFLEVVRGDVDLKALSEAQRKAAEGRYALAMSAWVRWLAGRLEEARDWVARRVEELRPHYAAEHGRHTDAAARLHATWEVYRRYAAEKGVDLAGLEAEVLQALQEAAQEQAAYLRDADPAERFVGLLQAALHMGRAHLVPVAWKPGEPPDRYMDDPRAWGWKWRDPLSASEFAAGAWEPQGAAIGWLPEDPEARGVYLDPKAAYAVLARLASETGEPLPTERTLWKRLGERGFIRTQVEEDGARYLVVVKVGGKARRVVHLLGAYISKTGNTGNRAENSVQDGENSVTGFPEVTGPTGNREAHSQGQGDRVTGPTGNRPKTGNPENAVQDAKNGAVTGVTGFAEGIPQELRTTPPEGGNGTPRLGSLAPLKGKEEEVAMRARAWELLALLKERDPERAQEFAVRLNRATAEELSGLLFDLGGALAKLTGEPVALPDGIWAYPDGSFVFVIL
ncbi:bifunctional DNA primase/polymerase [Thermus filiformis]|uniref:bifunctional DNA primase/polymerase n=1 Tax=Thermus filiformis TaxID=276 RepID=UPI0009E542FB|nr:bifunctional DNA primase/polymerase [Thermus filiformis]